MAPTTLSSVTSTRRRVSAPSCRHQRSSTPLSSVTALIHPRQETFTVHAVIVSFTPQQGCADRLEALLLRQASDSLEKERHCQRFDVVRLRNENTFVLYELYRDQDAFRWHLDTDHFHAFDQKSAPLVAEKKVLQGDLRQA
ncbi:MAG: hypothetical protein CME78_02290 [Halomonas sp.]|nr:hypothetical protein [Halomonas sp.]